MLGASILTTTTLPFFGVKSIEAYAFASLGKKPFVVAAEARKKLYGGGHPPGAVVHGAGGATEANHATAQVALDAAARLLYTKLSIKLGNKL